MKSAGASSKSIWERSITFGLPVISAVLVAALGFFGAVYAASVTAKLGQLTDAVDRSKLDLEKTEHAFDEAKFLTQAMRDSIPAVSGSDPAKASMTVSTLYFLARDVDSKAQVIEMAAFAQNPALNKTLLKLLNGDDVGKKIANRPEIVGLISFGASRAPGKVPGADVPSPGLQTDLLKTVTLASSAGWSYLGRATVQRDSSGNLIEPKSLDIDGSVIGSAMPAINAPISYRSPVYLRSGPPSGADNLQPIAGVIASGTKAILTQRRVYSFADRHKAVVWGAVQFICNTVRAGHGETDTPVCVGANYAKIFKVQDTHSTGIHVRNFGTHSIHVSLTPICNNQAVCPALKDAVVSPAKTAQDGGNDLIYTAQSLDPGFRFDWQLVSTP